MIQTCIGMLPILRKFIAVFASFPAALPLFLPQQMPFFAELEAVPALPVGLPPPLPDELVLLHSVEYSCK